MSRLSLVGSSGTLSLPCRSAGEPLLTTLHRRPSICQLRAHTPTSRGPYSLPEGPPSSVPTDVAPSSNSSHPPHPLPLNSASTAPSHDGEEMVVAEFRRKVGKLARLVLGATCFCFSIGIVLVLDWILGDKDCDDKEDALHARFG